MVATPLQAQHATPSDEGILVVADAPLPGTGIAVDAIAGEVQTFRVPALVEDRQTDVLSNLLGSQSASVSLNDEQGSPFQPDLTYRGFAASPISGVAEGLAVYQDGTRLNEAFGDNVNWDLIPLFAVDRVTIQSNNPVFGLNALGGAVTLDMKSGFGFQGFDAELSGGSFGNVTGNAEFGRRSGDLGVYVGIGGTHDDGFRYHSPTTLRQAYADLAYEHDKLALHLSLTGASNRIDAVGPTPVELLARDRKAVFTYPQAITNKMAMGQLRGSYRATGQLTLTAQGYYRRFDQHLIDGNTTDVDYCDNDAEQLCLEGDGDYPGDALYSSAGGPVPASALPDGATPGETDHTRTITNSVGGTVQASLTAPIASHANNLVVGASIDRGRTHYLAYGELGTLTDNLDVVGSGVVIDQGLSPTAQPPIEEPVDVRADNRNLGIYAIDVFDLTPRLTLTLSGRWNQTRIGLHDLTGGPLAGRHSFSHFNPGAGLAYRITSTLTAFAGFSEANRAPTAGELSCADPTSPCLLDAFLVSDPKLKQVVSRNVELGLRGRPTVLLPGTLSWSINAYRTNVRNDILLLATGINGFGYFQNAGTTRHQGIDVSANFRNRRWRVAASYAYLDLTFRRAQILSSNSPAADDDGLIYVQPGDHVPAEPQHRATFSADYDLTPRWSVGSDVRWQSGQYLIGDESDQEPKLPGFATVALRTRYAFSRHLELFGDIENLLNRRYYSYGTFTELDGLPPSYNLANPRSYSPAEGRAFTIGARARFE